MMVLMEKGFKVPGASEKEAVLLDKKLDTDKLIEVFAKAQDARHSGRVVNITNMKKNKKFQKDNLAQLGYTQIEDVYPD